SGVSDQVSSYNEITIDGRGRQQFYERSSQGSPYGIGITPWTAANLYIENSPVFFIGNIETPLLMMHGDLDAAVPIGQAMEMFLAMRRAGKKVWFLEYKHDDHELGESSAWDYTIRMMQFFDYYLQNAPPPFWMTGRKVSNGAALLNEFELDRSGQIP